MSEEVLMRSKVPTIGELFSEVVFWDAHYPEDGVFRLRTDRKYLLTIGFTGRVNFSEKEKVIDEYIKRLVGLGMPEGSVSVLIIRGTKLNGGRGVFMQSVLEVLPNE